MSGDDQQEGPGTGPDDLIDAVFGEGEEPDPVAALPTARKATFQPWHHPVKQIVRSKQWAALTARLWSDDRGADDRDVLRYFTLPGPDLLDVRVLSNALAMHCARIEYFGFDDRGGPLPEDDEPHAPSPPSTAESALLQANRVTSSARIYRDKLEDIANPRSQAGSQLSQQRHFDVVNIDACGHLGYVPRGRTVSTFDALHALLRHQLTAAKPWLLFVTTRAEPGLLGEHFALFQRAVLDNLAASQAQFGPALAACIGADLQTLTTDLSSAWTTPGERFLKLYALSVGKYLLQFYLGQLQHPHDLELKSAYGYRVYAEAPDMLSLAFRIIPRGLVVQPPSMGGAVVVPLMEAQHAVRVASRAANLWDLDFAIGSDEEVRREAVEGTARLLEEANYDLAAWSRWLASLALRPMNVQAA